MLHFFPQLLFLFLADLAAIDLLSRLYTETLLL